MNCTSDFVRGKTIKKIKNDRVDERVHDLLKDVSIAPPRGRVTARAAAQGHGEGPRYKAIKGIEINGRRIP